MCGYAKDVLINFSSWKIFKLGGRDFFHKHKITITHLFVAFNNLTRQLELFFEDGEAEMEPRISENFKA